MLKFTRSATAVTVIPRGALFVAQLFEAPRHTDEEERLAGGARVEGSFGPQTIRGLSGVVVDGDVQVRVAHRAPLGAIGSLGAV